MTPSTQPAAAVRSPTGAEWWRGAVIYQVYPRSFADSDGDGIGDLPGIAARVSHLARLGVDAVWLSPFYRSPQADAGYDVADYRAVDPLFGTLEDFDRLLRQAQAAGLRVVVDLVPNHTSDEHAWFRAAAGSRPGSPERARYIFRDGRGAEGGQPPNNWKSVFGGSAWSQVPGDRQWFLHLFDHRQPDLNWEHPEVRAELEAVLRFWLDRGVDGFRVDVAHGLVKAPGLPDWEWQAAMVGSDEADGVNHGPMWDQDGVHEIYRGWRRVLGQYPGQRMMVAEAWVRPQSRLARYVRPGEMQQAFNFDCLLAPWDASALRTVVEASLAAMEAVGAPATPTTTRCATRRGSASAGPAPDPWGSTRPVSSRTRRWGCAGRGPPCCSRWPCRVRPTSTRARNSAFPSTRPWRRTTARTRPFTGPAARRSAATALACRSHGGPAPRPSASARARGPGCRSRTASPATPRTSRTACRDRRWSCIARSCACAARTGWDRDGSAGARRGRTCWHSTTRACAWWSTSARGTWRCRRGTCLCPASLWRPRAGCRGTPPPGSPWARPGGRGGPAGAAGGASMNAHPPRPFATPASTASSGEPGPVPGRRTGRPRIVVLGGGFGGPSTVQALRRAPADITVIDQRNHHLFQPLLYQVATAGLSPAEITAPIRAVIGHFPNVRVLLGRVTGVDAARRRVGVEDASARTVPYDILVVATGARHSYFGHDEWAAFAPGLKTVEDAISIRRRILLAFERAETEEDPAERKRLLTFVVVGGGPTGVEMAGSVSEPARRIVTRDFHSLDPTSARIVLVEAGPRLLPTFAPDSSSYDARYLTRLGAQLRLNSLVTGIDASGVQLGPDRIEARTVIWAAGVEASPAAARFGAKHDRAGRVEVTDRLAVPGHPEIFVIGDTALILDTNGRPVPGLAPAAKEGGQYVARAIRMGLQGKDPGPFRYRHYGNLAALGRRSAIIEFGRLHLHGFVAWALWSVAHILFLIGFRNRVVVSLEWIWSYLSYRGGARLITGERRE